jgi:hypothetical protein
MHSLCSEVEVAWCSSAQDMQDLLQTEIHMQNLVYRFDLVKISAS